MLIGVLRFECCQLCTQCRHFIGLLGSSGGFLFLTRLQLLAARTGRALRQLGTRLSAWSQEAAVAATADQAPPYTVNLTTPSGTDPYAGGNATRQIADSSGVRLSVAHTGQACAQAWFRRNLASSSMPWVTASPTFKGVETQRC